MAIIEKRIADIKTELQQHPLYRELSILEKARDKLRALICAHEQTDGDAAPPRRPKDWRHQPRCGNAVTQLDGVELALEAAGRPLSTVELVAVLPNHGVTVGGKNPSTNLASVISKRGDRLQSVTWRGVRAWWFKGRSLPSRVNGVVHAIAPILPDTVQATLPDQVQGAANGAAAAQHGNGSVDHLPTTSSGTSTVLRVAWK